MLLLTYHRVQHSGGEGQADFYTVSEEQLHRHIEALDSHGYHPATVTALCAGHDDPRGFLLTFDDGTADHFSVVRPLVESHGLRGIFFVPTAKLDRPGYLSRGQVRELAGAGHTLGCHSHEHRRLDLLDAAAIRGQLVQSIGILEDLTGAPPQLFAPPGGYTNPLVRRIAHEVGLRALRTMKWGLNHSLRLDALECIPLNRHVTAARFSRILEGRGLRALRCLFLGKQALKRVLPLRAYSGLRARLSRRAS